MKKYRGINKTKSNLSSKYMKDCDQKKKYIENIIMIK